eukprot:TRINITY_DN93_c0_g4_i2.p1 TRINITY_DN93_c0_g4~~TRINITY_DN93_c0_g4_i2.p1  ORF type:complete len:247 (-),score=56.89 TRINITY_DN93_c0_g4_i2:358-1098(-)
MTTYYMGPNEEQMAYKTYFSRDLCDTIHLALNGDEGVISCSYDVYGKWHFHRVVPDGIITPVVQGLSYLERVVNNIKLSDLESLVNPPSYQASLMSNPPSTPKDSRLSRGLVNYQSPNTSSPSITSPMTPSPNTVGTQTPQSLTPSPVCNGDGLIVHDSRSPRIEINGGPPPGLSYRGLSQSQRSRGSDGGGGGGGGNGKSGYGGQRWQSSQEHESLAIPTSNLKRNNIEVSNSDGVTNFNKRHKV